VAFEACDAWWPIVLQHLLMGMNAHINLDLGIAAAQTSPGSELASLKGDFMRINEILASLVDEVQEELADVWPLLRILDWVGGRTDEAVVHFSMERARDAAWAVAQDLARREATEWSGAIAALDNQVAELGRLVRHPGPILGAATRLIRLGELRSVRRIINVLR
jgi:Family of unknown function (DUF5995)